MISRLITSNCSFYLLYPVFFWFFGRYHAEMAMRTYVGMDFLCSMPHYLEYAWIWLPILCSKYVSNDLAYCTYMSCFFSGFSRSKIISVKIFILLVFARMKQGLRAVIKHICTRRVFISIVQTICAEGGLIQIYSLR